MSNGSLTYADPPVDPLVDSTATIIMAYVSNNVIAMPELPSLISAVHAALERIDQPVADTPDEPRLSPGQIRKSVTPDALISFIDGKPYKALKRHLTGHGLTPADYRQKYGLPHDYPMVAANYAAQRSELAKSIGLGQGRVARRRAAGL